MNDKIQAKKSLGQNFLKSKKALLKMLEAGEVNGEDTVLEVGPGKGALTEKLLAKAKKVIAVEKDDRLISFLQEKFVSKIANGKLEIIHGDILNFSPQSYQLTANSYKLVANIPYYITGQFLRKFLASDYQPERVVVMVQKEIADRIMAHDNKESLLSISVKAYGMPKKVLKVDKENFSPTPKVDSAILLISDISKKLFTDNQISEKDFFEVLHVGFAHKRKMLLGNLKEWRKKDPSTYDVDGSFLEEIFSDCKIDLGSRAENLSPQNWAALVKRLTR